MNETTGTISRRRFFPHLLLAAIIMSASALFPGCDRAEEKPAAATETATIAYAAFYRSILAEIALVKGYFREERLDVTPRLHAYGKRALDDLLSGNADFATIAETPVVLAILDGADLVIVATIFKAARDHAIIGRKDRGVLAPGDLRGKKIATSLSTSAEFYLDSLLAVYGISRHDIELVELPQHEIPQALAEGKIDGAAVFEPYLEAAVRQLGDNGSVFFNKNLYTNTFNLVSTGKVVRQSPGKVDKAVRALCRAEEFFQDHPEEGVRIAAEFSQEDLAATRRMLTGASLELSLDQSLILTLEDEARWAIENGRTSAEEIPNFLFHIYPASLRSVRPERVRILE